MKNSISQALQQFVDSDRISGAVSLVARDGEIIHLEAIGVSNLNTQRPMQTDDVFYVASMTKPITAGAVLVMIEEKKLALEDPIAKYLPEFGAPWLIATKTDERMELVRPKTAITIHDLLRHTHGLAETASPHAEATLAEHARAIAREPLDFEPGTNFRYGNSGMVLLGRVIELISGQSYAEFLHHTFFSPLGMKDTALFLTPAQVKRLAQYYGPAPEGGLQEVENPLIRGDVTSTKRTPFPGGGLFSTAMDMFRFYQMIANGGTFEGRRYLLEKTVRVMTSTQTGNLKCLGTGMTYGLGINVYDPGDEASMLARGSYGHDGASGTSAFVDPTRKAVMIHMLQRTGLWGEKSEGSTMRMAFQKAAIEALDAG